MCCWFVLLISNRTWGLSYHCRQADIVVLIFIPIYIWGIVYLKSILYTINTTCTYPGLRPPCKRKKKWILTYHSNKPRQFSSCANIHSWQSRRVQNQGDDGCRFLSTPHGNWNMLCYNSHGRWETFLWLHVSMSINLIYLEFNTLYQEESRKENKTHKASTALVSPEFLIIKRRHHHHWSLSLSGFEAGLPRCISAKAKRIANTKKERKKEKEREKWGFTDGEYWDRFLALDCRDVFQSSIMPRFDIQLAR